MFDARQGAGKDVGGGLIPKNQLAFVSIVKAAPAVAKSGLRYVDMELVIEPGQPYERKHLWHNLMDPTDPNQKDVTRTISTAMVSRILEVARGAHPQNNPQGYVINDWSELVGLRAAIKIGIEKGKDGYGDKNNVEFITPNPESSVSKLYQMLLSGQYNSAPGATPAPAQASMGFGQTPAPAQHPSRGPDTTFGQTPGATPGAQAAPQQHRLEDEIPFNQAGGQQTPPSGNWIS